MCDSDIFYYLLDIAEAAREDLFDWRHFLCLFQPPVVVTAVAPPSCVF